MSSGSTIECPDGHVALVFYGSAGELRRIFLPKCVLHIEADTEVSPLLEMNSGLQITNIVRDELDAYHPSQQAKVIHKKMREFWEQTNGTGLDKDLEDLRWHLGRILFLQRKRVGSTDASQLGLAFASQERTCRAIQDVLELRQSYLRSNGIELVFNSLSNKQRVGLVERAREQFENSQEQRDLEVRDRRIWARKQKERDSNGASRRGNWTCRSARQPAQERFKAFLEKQKQKRWCQHLHDVYGTQRIWEILAFTGTFDPCTFRDVLRLCGQDGSMRGAVQRRAARRQRLMEEKMRRTCNLPCSERKPQYVINTWKPSHLGERVDHLRRLRGA